MSSKIFTFKFDDHSVAHKHKKNKLRKNCTKCSFNVKQKHNAFLFSNVQNLTFNDLNFFFSLCLMSKYIYFGTNRSIHVSILFLIPNYVRFEYTNFSLFYSKEEEK